MTIVSFNSFVDLETVVLSSGEEGVLIAGAALAAETNAINAANGCRKNIWEIWVSCFGSYRVEAVGTVGLKVSEIALCNGYRFG